MNVRGWQGHMDLNDSERKRGLQRGEAPSWQTHLIQKNSLLTFSVLDEFLEELTGTLGGLRQSVQSLLTGICS